MRARRRVLVLLTMLALAAGQAVSLSAASAGTYPPSPPDSSVSDTTPRAGQPFTFAGSGCDANAAVELFVNKLDKPNKGVVQTFNLEAGTLGRFSQQIEISDPGRYQIQSECPSGGDTLVLTQNVRVRGGGGDDDDGEDGDDGDDGGLADTGADPSGIVLVGSGLLLGGGLLVGLSMLRRRRAQQN